MVAAVRLHPVQVRSAQRAGRISEILFDKGLVQSDRFKQLGALVRLQRRNAHLGSDLQYAGCQRAVVIRKGFRRVELHRAVFAQFTDPLMRQVRVDRPGAEGNQQRQLVDIPRLSAFEHHGNRRPLLDADQVLLQRGNRQQRRNRQVFRVHAPVGEDQYIDLVPACLVARREQRRQRVPEGACFFVQQGNGPDLERRVLQFPDPPEFLFRQDRARQFKYRAVFRIAGKQVPVVPDIHGAVRLDFFTQRVDRRVGHLRETLFEVIEQRGMCFGQCRQRFVRAHGYDGLCSVLRHRPQDVLRILPGIVECFGQLRQSAFACLFGFFRNLRQVLQPDQVLHPFVVRERLRIAGFDLAALRQFPGFQVRLQHVAGCQLPPADDMCVFFEQHAGFRRKDQPVVVCQGAPQRAQAVPVQGRADLFAVGIQHRRRPVPGLHHRCIVAVKIAPRRLPVLDPLPGFRQQDHSGQGQRDSVHRQEF